jgi:hypothetical protein
MSGHRQQPSNGRESWPRLLLTHGPAWITAIVGAIAALGIGFGAGYRTSQAQSSGPAPTFTVTAQAPGPRSPAPSPASSGGTASSPVSNPPVYHQGALTLNPGEQADLDSRLLNWGAPSPNGADVENDGSNLAWLAPGMATLGSLPATYQGCSSTTSYLSNPEPLGQILPNMNFCVKTDQGRFSLLHVTKVDPAGQYIVLDVTTWQPTGNR